MWWCLRRSGILVGGWFHYALLVVVLALLLRGQEAETAKGLPDRIPIGAIFMPRQEELRYAYEHAMEVHNLRDPLFGVTTHTEIVESDDPYQTSKKRLSPGKEEKRCRGQRRLDLGRGQPQIKRCATFELPAAFLDEIGNRDDRLPPGTLVRKLHAAVLTN
ncbi:hypothetical protein HPB49_014167 [Dermacentor silvarum]|uniref:Uncharacterized protein n=1 Tax=Dermacentor silvarum TaxID=543639 RepID=A0ACB8CXP1_DERSI|nr:hypothetical protein HPB49_014167 [Dermacentor silvarum]